MSYAERALSDIAGRNPNQPEFHQAVEEVFDTLSPLLDTQPQYEKHRVLERIGAPERIISFRVVWENDEGGIEINTGYRVQFHTLLGPAKGGLRFHKSVNESILKFLAFEQAFKNALTPLSMGAGKGGSDFDPHGRSNTEIMRFCQAFMTELSHHVGPHVDVPAGDIGVGGREIGYLFGQYRRMTHRWEGVLTGKGVQWGGSQFRADATGVGAVQFASLMAMDRDDDLDMMKAAISGAGNVAIFAARELLERRATVVSLSDSGGSIYFPEGATLEAIDEIERVKIEKGGRLSEVELSIAADYREGVQPWDLECDLVLPCATQNELGREDAERLVSNGAKYVVEGANMPCTVGAHEVFRESGVLVGPGKAANAGGVAVSGLEMHQNATFRSWSRSQVQRELNSIMKTIYRQCSETAAEFGDPTNLAMGANIAGFRRLATAMIAQGLY